MIATIIAVHRFSVSLLLAITLACAARPIDYAPGVDPEAITADFESAAVVVDTAHGRTLSGVDAMKVPGVLRRVPPRYPNAAKEARVAGLVVVEVLADASGVPASVSVVSEPGSGLGEAAAEAVRQWRFLAPKRGGTAMPSLFRVTINMKLR